MSTLLEKNIKILDFSFIEKNKNEGSGVLLTDNFESLDKDITTPEVLFALETAKKFDADAVYFRYFDDGRGAIPQIYIYDNTSDSLTEKRRDIHIKIWSGCQVPMYIIINKSEAMVYDAREKAEEDKENTAVDTIKFAGEAIKKFSALDLDDGLFWEEEYNKKHFQYGKSVYRDLISGLKKVYKDFQNDSGLDNHVALKLLVQCLLIKYLEEREEENVSGYFAEKYFQNSFGCKNFCEVIRTGKLLELLDQLSIDFNGKIFEWDKERETTARKKIKRAEVNRLAEYLDGKIKNDSYVLWRLYSFSHLPVELISSVYEELLTNSEVTSKDIVYTPEMIVSTLIDECMPLKSPQKDFKVIDVSCGSGIFLVKAYKRIIQWWRYERWKETGRLEKPPLKKLKELLIDNIYGVDINEDAIRLTVFSLALAMLDEVDLIPRLWRELKFPVLSEKTIKTQNFFEYITQNPLNDFDLVIGNPPFNLQSQNGKEPSRKKYFSDQENECGYKSEIKIPDENPALHFLTKAITLLKPGAMLCLIQPSGPILYQKDVSFKQAMFSKYNLLQIIDFTKLADALWGKANVATAAVFLQNSLPDQNDVVHIVANKTFSNVNKLFLEFDHYDFHLVNKDAVINNPYVWKANLLGGGRIANLLERLSSSRKLGDFIKQKTKYGWIKGEGFIENKNGITVDYITNKKFLPTEALDEDGIDYTKIHRCEIRKFQRKTNEQIFLSPHLLIRKILGTPKLIAELAKQDLVFKSDIFGIHAPKKDKDELNKLCAFIKTNSSLLRFYILATSSKVKVLRATSLYDEDILNIPYPEKLSDIKSSKTENLFIEDLLQYSFSSDSEKILVSDAVKTDIVKFYQIFCKTLNSVYETGNKSFRLYKILDCGKYYAVHFEYTKEKYKPEIIVENNLEEYIKEIIPTEKKKGKSSHIQRILKAYGKDRIILAKPKQLRYWLPSIALRDADEAFADYVKARYY
jgi:methylase of polypeptide subunit release factors